jgi:hypothetical protein
MRVFDKTCPACETAFEAKRRNQLYCSPECRADINNIKLKAKFNSIKTLENEKSIGDKYKAAYLSAIRIVAIEYDHKDKNEIINFEGRKYEKIADDAKPLDELGIRLGEKSVQDNQRLAIFFPNDALLCFMPQYNSFSNFNNEVTYQLRQKTKNRQ